MNRCKGHTLVELLIAMSLSLLILAALIQLNSGGIKVSNHQRRVANAVRNLDQALNQMHTEISLASHSDCLLYKNHITDYVFSNPLNPTNFLVEHWIKGSTNDSWHPETPAFNNSNIEEENDAINLLFSDPSNPLTLSYLNSHKQRIVYVTNCLQAFILHGGDIDISGFSNSTENLLILPFQSIIYYLRETDSGLTLYRQYLTTTGKSRNEPLIDQLDSLVFGYAEQIDNNLEFKTASNVTDWDVIKAIYVKIKLSVNNIPHTFSKIVILNNV